MYSPGHSIQVNNNILPEITFIKIKLMMRIIFSLPTLHFYNRSSLKATKENIIYLTQFAHRNA
jgi:hypothetical protein